MTSSFDKRIQGFPMNVCKIAGIAIIVIAVLILRFAYNAANVPLGQFTESVTDQYRNGTVWYFIFGIFVLFGGIVLSTFKTGK